MTALEDRPSSRQVPGIPPAAAYEWRIFLRLEAHCYRRDQLAATYPIMLMPWCEEARPFGLKHERYEIGDTRIAAPHPAWTCPECAALLRGASGLGPNVVVDSR